MATSLLNNCALVIDDGIGDNADKINGIIKTLESEGTLFVKSEKLLEKKSWENLSGISFIILDWDIETPEEKELKKQGNTIPAALRVAKISNNLNFIKEMLKRYFVPVFIFTQHDIDTDVIPKLQGDINIAPILGRRVFVYDKNNLIGKKTKVYFDQWLRGNKTVLTLKMFEEQLNRSKDRFLTEMGELSTDWVRVVYQTLKKDYKKKDQPLEFDLLNSEFNEFLFNSLLSRFENADFSSVEYSQLKKGEISNFDINKIYESIKFFQYKTSAHASQAYEGDLYRKKNNASGYEDEFYVNINAPCDLRSDMLLLVRGILVDELYKPKADETKPVYDLKIFMDKKAIQFKFRTTKHHKLKHPKNLNVLTIGQDTYERIGRITHPYITAIRSEFAHFISRQGTPRHPK